jgi:sugar phosphate isomerase/epimerase
MIVNRRSFLGALGAGSVSLVKLRAASIARVGVQLYTVRTEMEKDFDATIAKVAALGYKEVEFAGYFNRTPEQVRDVLKKNGLTAPSTHIDYASLAPDKFPAIIDASRTMGHTFIVNPWIDETMRKDPDVWKKMADTYDRAGEMTRKAGIQFAYHNHNFEFVPANGKLPYDYLLETCDRNLVKMEMDLCWIVSAGRDPLDYFRKYPGRFPMVHVKGLAKIPVGGAATPIDKVLPDVVDVGHRDAIDWKRIFAQSRLAGIEHYFVEHDIPKVPFESLQNSFDYLSRLQF